MRCRPHMHHICAGFCFKTPSVTPYINHFTSVVVRPSAPHIPADVLGRIYPPIPSPNFPLDIGSSPILGNRVHCTFVRKLA